VQAEAGLPQDAIERGFTTQAGYQLQVQKDESAAQLAQQQKIADAQAAENQRQLEAQQAAQAKQQADVAAQAKRQTDYDTGRNQALAEGTAKIGDAFSKFSPEYFQNYAKDYLTQASDQINRQETAAQRSLLFGLARQGLGQSQASVDQMGLLKEDTGRATADATQKGLDASNQLAADVAGKKQNLTQQLVAAQSIGSPIAGSDDASVQGMLNTQKNAMSGITNSSGDTVASLSGVPQVNTLANIFGNLMTSAGSYMGGVNANTALNQYYSNAGLKAPNSTGAAGGSTSFK
jgi:hypothetical protein